MGGKDEKRGQIFLLISLGGTRRGGGVEGGGQLTFYSIFSGGGGSNLATNEPVFVHKCDVYYYDRKRCRVYIHKSHANFSNPIYMHDSFFATFCHMLLHFLCTAGIIR